jgi:hypothetical protein
MITNRLVEFAGGLPYSWAVGSMVQTRRYLSTVRPGKEALEKVLCPDISLDRRLAVFHGRSKEAFLGFTRQGAIVVVLSARLQQICNGRIASDRIDGEDPE